MTEPSLTQDTDTLTRRAAELQVGDRIAAGFLPSAQPADVLFVHPYVNRRHDRVDFWMFVAYSDGYGPDCERFIATATIPLERAADDGMGYSRDTADDPTPVSPARAPLHTGSVVEGDHLVIDQPGPCAPIVGSDRVTGVPLCQHGDDAYACQLAHTQAT
jgi:hypothetical protein